MKTVATTTVWTWTCDSCETTATANGEPPPKENRVWAHLKWEQPGGFFFDRFWGNRVQGDGTIDLCPTCADRVFAALQLPPRNDGTYAVIKRKVRS